MTEIVHGSVTDTMLLPLLLITIVTSVGLGLPHLQDSYAGTENSQDEQESNASESSDEQSEESAGIDSEETSNLTSMTPGPEAITTAPSDLIPRNETSNQTEELFKPQSKIERQLSSDLLQDFSIATPPPPYRVKVTFNSMTIHNSHEGAFSGDGEYDIAAYVQGKKVGLTDASGPGDGLWDVSSGETVTFDPGTEVTVDIPNTLPLSILTVGSEVDGCGRTAFPEDIQDGILRVLTLGGALKPIQDQINSGINWVGCKLNGNDVLGVINAVYEPTSYGAGPHEVKSDKGDFTLRYTISVTAPPAPENRQGNLQPNKFTSQLDNELTLDKPNVTSDVVTKGDKTTGGIIGKIQ